jgi:alkylhydroperoxidase family enzyme
MSRIPALASHEIADPELRALAEASGDEMFGVYGHCPEAFSRFLAFYRPLKYGGRLPFELKELVRLRIAELNDCQR